MNYKKIKKNNEYAKKNTLSIIFNKKILIDNKKIQYLV